MDFIKVITATQVLSGIIVLLVSVVFSLKTLKSVSGDLRGRWALVISFLVFFILAYIFFLYINVSGMMLRMELVAGSILLAGACFVLLVVMIAKTTVKRLLENEYALRLYNDSLMARKSELKDEIAERAKAESRLIESEEKYRSLVESTDDSIYVVDRESNYIFMNEKHQQRLQLSRDSYMGRSYGEFHPAVQADWFSLSIEEVLSTGRSTQFEYQSERDGRFFLQTMSPVRDRAGEIVAVSVISKNITHLKHLEDELRFLSLTDELTGLYNRRGFFTLAEQQIRMASRLNKGVHLLYVDVDYLKLINDNLGHNEGDRALVKLGELLKVTYRESDIIARIGGDEFAVFPVESVDGEMESVTRRLQDNIEQSNAKGQDKFALSISTGIAYYDPESPVNLEDLLKEADRAMYKQKKAKSQL
jgi:diguanylate cyclase (GGDEF)-like protein/PAS domain S-box-containing protein